MVYGLVADVPVPVVLPLSIGSRQESVAVILSELHHHFFFYLEEKKLYTNYLSSSIS